MWKGLKAKTSHLHKVEEVVLLQQREFGSVKQMSMIMK